MNIKQWVADNTIHRIVAGSHLYGTARKDSDIDIRGVCLAPPESLIGLSEFKQYQGSKDEDTTIYELRRFCHLVLNANPNILDILFAPHGTWEILDYRWQLIYDNRNAFLSQKAKRSFTGFSTSLLKRIQRHKKWLDSPPTHEPTQEEFGGMFDGATFQFPKIAREKEYRAASERWKNYQRWLKERNPYRAELERKHGYDSKFALHIARLLLGVESILREGTYNPVLSDDRLLIVRDIMNGDWSYEEVLGWAEDMEAHINEMPTSLPRKPNHILIEQLCMQIYREEFRKESNELR